MHQIASRPLPYMTTDEFLAWPGDGSGRKFQLFDGEVRAMSPASNVHGVIQANLAQLLLNSIEAAGLSLTVVTEGAIIPGLYAETNVRVPDLVVMPQPGQRGEIAAPNPIVVVEILSPGNTSDTRDNVRSYATLASVQEILVVHSSKVRIEYHARDGQWHWQAAPKTLDRGQTLNVRAAGLEVAVERVYRRTWLA